MVHDPRCIRHYVRKPDLSVALPAIVASSGKARLTGAFETNWDQFKRDPTRYPLAMKKAAINAAICYTNKNSRPKRSDYIFHNILILFVKWLVAGVGFEPTIFRLWVRLAL